MAVVIVVTVKCDCTGVVIVVVDTAVLEVVAAVVVADEASG